GKAPKDRVVEAGTKDERAEWKRATEMIDRQIKALKDGLTAFTQPLREQLIEERLKHLAAATREKVIQAANTPEKKRTPEQQALLKEHAKAIAVGDDELAQRFPEFAALRDQVKNTTAAREKD